MRSLFTRRILAANAIRYANAGWPLAPGAWWDHDHNRYRCPAAPCPIAGLHPAGGPGGGHPPPASVASTDATTVRAWWSVHNHTLLLPTGFAFDVLEVTAQQASHAWKRLHRGGLTIPAAELPTGRWLLFIAPVAALSPSELPGDVIHHGAGSYVPAPPSTLRRGPVRWTHAPWIDGWILPEPQAVIDALASTQPVRATPTRAAVRL